MNTNARSLVFPRMFAALAACLVLASVAQAAGSKDRVYQFGDDPFENGGNPAALVGTGMFTGTSDSFAWDPIVAQDYQELSPGGTPTYVNTVATGRPGAIGPVELGASFNGTTDHL